MLPSKICLRSLPGPSSKLNSKTKKNVSSPNLFIYLKDQLVMAEREKLSECQYISENCANEQKILLIEEELDPTMFRKIMNFFQGDQLELTSMKDLAACLNILDFLQAKKLILQIEEKIEQDIQSYDIFCLLQISFSYGLQKVFDLCLRYLEFDQFQQIKYNKFSLMECNFKLFQAILRRHHVLKMKGQIEGLDPFDIQEVIHTYCRRHKIDHHTHERLLEKYLSNLQKFQRVKTSLRLDKLAHKNILQSANIDTDFYQNDHVICLIDLEHMPASRIKHEIRKRKYSQQVSKDILLVKQMKFSNNQTPISNLLDDDSVEEVEQLQPEMSHYQVNIKGAQTVHISNEDKVKEYLQLGQQKRGQMGSIVSKISQMRNQYEEALHEHDQKYRSMRRNSKSQFLSEFGNDLISKAKLLCSSNLKQHQPLFKIFSMDQ